MIKSFGPSRLLTLLRNRGATILLVVVYLAAAGVMVTAALLLLDQPLSAGRISSQQERVDTSTLDQLKTFRQRQTERLQQPLPIRRDPFIGP